MMSCGVSCRFDDVVRCVVSVSQAGSDSSERIASQLQGPQHRHLLSPKLAGESASLEAAGGIPLEPRHVSEHNPEGIYIHGGGMARALFNDCVKEDLAAAALVHFCSAG